MAKLRDYDGLSLLAQAVRCQKWNCVEEVLNLFLGSPLMEFVKEGAQEEMEALLTTPGLNAHLTATLALVQSNQRPEEAQMLQRIQSAQQVEDQVRGR
jgi:hypothetical protein